MLDRFAGQATAAFQQHYTHLPFGFGRRRELDSPEIVRRVHEGYTIGVDLGLDPNLADQTHFRLFVRIEAADNQFLLGGKLVTRNDACSVPAQQHRFRRFREDFAFGVAANQKDSDLFWNSATSAHSFGGHLVTHSERIER